MAKLGDIVVLKLGQHTVDQIRALRAATTGEMRLLGNEVTTGQEVPAMVVTVWGDGACCNLKAFLDGNHDAWVPSAYMGNEVSQWRPMKNTDEPPEPTVFPLPPKLPPPPPVEIAPASEQSSSKAGDTASPEAVPPEPPKAA